MIVGTAVIFLALPGTGCSKERAGTQVVLSWNAVPGEQDGFRVERAIDGVHFEQIQTLPDGTSSTTVVGIGRGLTYTFRIRGYNSGGYSPYSQTVSVVIPAAR
jgi:hypothetical protein